MPRSPARRAEDLPEYSSLLATVRQLLEQGRNEAYQRIDQIRARTYVAIGAEILSAELRQRQRADYGRQVIAALSRDLGFSECNVYNKVAVARVFATDSLPMPMSWSHLVRLKGTASRHTHLPAAHLPGNACEQAALIKMMRVSRSAGVSRTSWSSA